MVTSSEPLTMKTTPFWTIAVLLLLGCNMAKASDEIPGTDPVYPIVLTGGTIHPISGKPVEGGQLLFDQGRIVALGKQIALPDNTQILDVTGKHVYPGLFDAHSSLGLVEINMVRATRDVAETGSLNPNVRVEVAVNPDSEMIPVSRSGGVLLTLTVPRGDLVAGRSAVLQLDGWTWEDMTLQSQVGMHVKWPSITPLLHWSVNQSAQEQMKQRDERLRQLQHFIDDARNYARARAVSLAANREHDLAYDARLEAMLPVIERRMPVIVMANELQQIQSAIAFSLRENLKLVLVGGYDAAGCSELLRQHRIPVIINGTLRLTRRRSDPYDDPFTLPERLRQAGIKFCIANRSRFGASNVRNLPYHAAMATAHGLPLEEALRAITLYPAQILGVADRVGSLEPGKHATLIITDGNPLETTTHVLAAFIQGRRVDLNDRHKRLWNKYQQKYRQHGAATRDVPPSRDTLK
ncbi:MAG: imidazolonepropionase [Planctomycetaceae bacterium]|nr:imidazolonepropionase [Planctomycetaceae bacterium]